PSSVRPPDILFPTGGRESNPTCWRLVSFGAPHFEEVLVPQVESAQASVGGGDSRSLDTPLPLEAVIITSELSRRTLRDRDLAAEHHAVTALMEELAIVAGKPGSDRILQRLVETARRLCQADTAGISMLEMH